MYTSTNSRTYIGSEIHDHHTLVVADGVIDAICPGDSLPAGIERRDLARAALAAGFIDLQLNGCGGAQFNDSLAALSVETLETMQAVDQHAGCASLLPTLITNTDEFMRLAVEVIRAFFARYEHQALGLHLKDSYLNPAKKGTHDPALMPTPTEKIVEFLCVNSDLIKKMTQTRSRWIPHVIRQLSAAGIGVSIGHSNATYDQAKAGFAAGISFAAHLFNGMPSLIGHEPGVIGALFDTPPKFTAALSPTAFT